MIRRRDLQLVQNPASPAVTLHTIFQPATSPWQLKRARQADPMLLAPQTQRRAWTDPALLKGTGTPELTPSSSPLVQHTLRVLNWRYRESCHITPWLTPMLSMGPKHNELTSEKLFTAGSEGSI